MRQELNQFSVEAGLGRQVPRDWDRNAPWSCIFIQLTKDDAYWAEKVHIPASAWVAAASRGQLPSKFTSRLQDSIGENLPPGHELGDPRRQQSNRDKRAARNRKHQADMDELRTLRQKHGQKKNPTNGVGGKDSGGKGIGKSKDQSGTPVCFSWASGRGVCGKQPPGAECLAPIKRAHKCRKCVSPSYQDAACTKA